MQKLFTALLLAFSMSALGAETASLKVELSGLAEVEGKIYIAVYDSSDTWLGDEVVASQAVDIVSSRIDQLVHAELTLPPGDYAFSIFYDVNGNGELDANFIGIPKEPVALSNNARPKFGPPKFKDAVFTLGADGVTQQLSIEAI